ncbi:hypothetical protein [Photobacterium kishitanii]|uniref:Uncharacterized protein n=1 Tax=Photobacterium kishitanii TaxID=318456 RepID=A0A2T3KLG1_9GAMM|nr:hypothetical protein [Photobacterium kishitanii]PSV00555.1 hypothetical protein C9J27_05315 [Photobacterium kishitanii]
MNITKKSELITLAADIASDVTLSGYKLQDIQEDVLKQHGRKVCGLVKELLTAKNSAVVFFEFFTGSKISSELIVPLDKAVESLYNYDVISALSGDRESRSFFCKCSDAERDAINLKNDGEAKIARQMSTMAYVVAAFDQDFRQSLLKEINELSSKD